MRRLPRHVGRVRNVMLSAALGAAACTSPVSPGNTASFSLTGMALVRGVVLDSARVPQDSVQVMLNLPEGSALYGVSPSLTVRDGALTLVVERRGAILASDSVRAVLNASSLRTRDRTASGSSRVTTTPLWVHFARTPTLPTARVVEVILPGAP